MFIAALHSFLKVNADITCWNLWNYSSCQWGYRTLGIKMNCQFAKHWRRVCRFRNMTSQEQSKGDPLQNSINYRGNSVTSDNCPQVTSLESASVGAADYKFEKNTKNGQHASWPRGKIISLFSAIILLTALLYVILRLMEPFDYTWQDEYQKEKESEKNIVKISALIIRGNAYLPVYPSFVLVIHALFQLSSQARQVKLQK